MKHRVSLKKLSKTPAHRKAMIRNMLVALFREERIKTTLAKARVLRCFAERLITRARKDGVHNRRMARKWIQDKAVLNKLFVEIGQNYIQRHGGYTRIVKIGPRYGDASEMAYIALVADESQVPAAPKKMKKQTKALASAQADAKPKELEKLTDKTKFVDKESISHIPEKKDSDETVASEAIDPTPKSAEKSDDGQEQEEQIEQRKHTSRDMHSAPLQKIKASNAVQQKAQRYRSDKGN